MKNFLKKKVNIDTPPKINIPDGFTPIADIKPQFKTVSHVASLSQPFTFLDTKEGIIDGYMQRYDRALGGPENPKKTDIVFLTKAYKILDKVTHFKTTT